jgi:hypothetical protein
MHGTENLKKKPYNFVIYFDTSAQECLYFDASLKKIRKFQLDTINLYALYIGLRHFISTLLHSLQQVPYNKELPPLQYTVRCVVIAPFIFPESL